MPVGGPRKVSLQRWDCGCGRKLPGCICQCSGLKTILYSSGTFSVALTLCDPLPPAPLPMAHIEKLAADCMQDVEEEEEEEGLEEDADLLVRLPGWCRGLCGQAVEEAWVCPSCADVEPVPCLSWALVLTSELCTWGFSVPEASLFWGLSLIRLEGCRSVLVKGIFRHSE